MPGPPDHCQRQLSLMPVWIRRALIAPPAVLVLLVVAAAAWLDPQLRPEPLQGRGDRLDEGRAPAHARDRRADRALGLSAPGGDAEQCYGSARAGRADEFAAIDDAALVVDAAAAAAPRAGVDRVEARGVRARADPRRARPAQHRRPAGTPAPRRQRLAARLRSPCDRQRAAAFRHQPHRAQRRAAALEGRAGGARRRAACRFAHQRAASPTGVESPVSSWRAVRRSSHRRCRALQRFDPRARPTWPPARWRWPTWTWLTRATCPGPARSTRR